LTHNGCASPVIIPTRHMGEESDAPILHKIFISCTQFRGKDTGALQVLLQDNLSKQYEDVLLHPDNDFNIPEDFVDIIATTMAKAAVANRNIIELKKRDLLYLLKYNGACL